MDKFIGATVGWMASTWILLFIGLLTMPSLDTPLTDPSWGRVWVIMGWGAVAGLTTIASAILALAVSKK